MAYTFPLLKGPILFEISGEIISSSTCVALLPVEVSLWRDLQSCNETPLDIRRNSLYVFETALLAPLLLSPCFMAWKIPSIVSSTGKTKHALSHTFLIHDKTVLKLSSQITDFAPGVPSCLKAPGSNHQQSW